MRLRSGRTVGLLSTGDPSGVRNNEVRDGLLSTGDPSGVRNNEVPVVGRVFRREAEANVTAIICARKT
jgi:hypothetical protein